MKKAIKKIFTIIVAGIAVMIASIITVIEIIMAIYFMHGIIDGINAEAFITSDYSKITYDGDVYVPISLGDLPQELKQGSYFKDNNEWIDATVKNPIGFMFSNFLTDQIIVEEYKGNKFIYLNTDDDNNESDYYCTVEYKKALTDSAEQ